MERELQQPIETQQNTGNRIRRNMGRIAAVVGLSLGTGVALESQENEAQGSSEPNFKAPWDCGVTLHSSTYPNHVPDGKGVDFNNLQDGSDDGMTVRASASGTATAHYSVNQNGLGYGHYVKINHGTWETRYAHLAGTPTLTDQDHVTPGIQVDQGDPIGVIGTSGATGAHLHYEQRENGAGRDVRFDGQLIPMRNETTYTWTPDYPTHTSTNTCEEPDNDQSDNIGVIQESSSSDMHWNLNGAPNAYYGDFEDIHVVGDWDGDGDDDKGYIELSSSNHFHWVLDGVPNRYYGGLGHTPIVGDWDGDGDDDIGFTRPSSSADKYWSLDGAPNRYFGDAEDTTVIGDWNGDSSDDIGYIEISSSNHFHWVLDGVANRYYGGVGHNPIVGDWDGDGDDNIGFTRPSSSNDKYWSLDGMPNRYFGDAEDIPIIGDWNGDGSDDLGYIELSSSNDYHWVRDWVANIYFGSQGDIPIVGDWDNL